MSATHHWCFGPFRLDPTTRSLWRHDVLLPLPPKPFAVLAYLVAHAGQVVAKETLLEAVWPETAVTEGVLKTCLGQIREVLGETARTAQYIATLHRRGYRFLAPVMASPAVVSAVTATLPPVALDERQLLSPSLPSPGNAIAGQQEVRFCRTPDGVQLAYSSIGAGPPLVKTGNWMTHLAYDLESPIWRHVWRALAREHTLIRYDARGHGLSDWNVDTISFEAFVHDLATVCEATGFARFALLGISQGCAVAIAFAVQHPERVSHLVLYGGFAQGRYRRLRSESQQEEDAAMLTLMRLGWGKENPAFRQLFTSQFVPGATKEQAEWFNELQRLSTSPECAVRYMQASGAVDVMELLPQVQVPTLVLHARDDARVPFELGRRMAASIPGARFVPLQSKNHLILEHEPAFQQFLEEVRLFLQQETQP
jgi:pimeloyl-ACP methyl ester carboxylesterase/DNA-binding winged helix-turn-helix (wHTH) protein